MNRLLFAAAVTALVASGATADTGSCLALTDPAGDVVPIRSGVSPNIPLAAADIVALDASATTAAVSVTFTLAGAPDPAPAANYEYWLDFADATHEYRLQADVPGAGIRVPSGSLFELLLRDTTVGTGNGGVGSWVRHAATGSVDLAAKTVTITADASLFGSLTSGQEWTVTRGSTSVGVLGTAHNGLDDVNGPHTLVVGAGC